VPGQQRRFETGLLTYRRNAELRNVVTAPIIYPVLLPLLLLDLAVGVYQVLCFARYGIGRVGRREHLACDGPRRACRNPIEKIHCACCSNANGLMACARELVGRTEPYGCPIQHARRIDPARPPGDTSW